MKLKHATLLLGLTAGAFSEAANAATYQFEYTTLFSPTGETVTASGSFEASYKTGAIYDVTSISGVVNGSPITSLGTGAGNYFLNSVDSNNEYLSLITGSGGYMFTTSFTSRDGSSDKILGNFAVSPVPLPASAPLFGSALLALAGLGYFASRRASATEARRG